MIDNEKLISVLSRRWWRVVVYELFLNSIPVDYYVERKYMEHELVTYHYVPWWRIAKAKKEYGEKDCKWINEKLNPQYKIGENYEPTKKRNMS